MRKGIIRQFGAVLIAVVAAFVCNMDARAQKNVDNGLAGVWIMESLQWEGEKKVMCGKASSYSQVKFYGKDGEYACAEVAKTKDGKYVVMPHEYGKYTYANGEYTEMGRKGNLKLNGDTFTGQWKARHDAWKRCTTMPKPLLDYIIMRCKANQEPSADIQKSIRKCFFEK